MVGGKDLEPRLRVIRGQREPSRDGCRDYPPDVVSASGPVDIPTGKRHAGRPEAIRGLK